MSNSNQSPAASFDRAISLLADIASPSFPFEISETIRVVVINQLVGDIFGKSLDEVEAALELALEENKRFQLRDGKVWISVEVDGTSARVELGMTAGAVARVCDDSDYINRREQFRDCVVSSQEISDCRAWLEARGYLVVLEDREQYGIHPSYDAACAR